MYCYTYVDLPSSITAADVCATGMEVASCPSANQSGCCENIAVQGASYSYGYCLYSLPAADVSALQSACTSENGTWTAP